MPAYYLSFGAISDQLRLVNASGVISAPAFTSVDTYWNFIISTYGYPNGFGQTLGLASDSLGNTYAGTNGWAVVWKISPTFVVTRAAGTGTVGYTGDNGPATSAELNNAEYVACDAAGNLYISDAGQNVIRAVNMQATTQTLLGVSIGAGNINTVVNAGVGLNNPQGIAVDASGNLYIADDGNKIVRKVSTSGSVTTVAGNGSSSFTGDNGPATSAAIGFVNNVACDTAGNIYLSYAGAQRVRVVNMQGTTQTLLNVSVASGNITTVAGTGTGGYTSDNVSAITSELNFPEQSFLDSSGNLYISDTSNFRTRLVTASTGIITTVAGTGSNGNTGNGGPATSAKITNASGLFLVSPAAPPVTGKGYPVVFAVT